MPTLAELYGQPAEPKREPTLAEMYGNPDPVEAAPEPKAQPTLAELYGTPDESPAVAPQSPAEGDSRGFLSTIGKAAQLPFDVLAEVPGVVKDYVTPSGQERLLSDPSTAGIAGAVLGPLAVAGGGLAGDSPIAQTERENRHAANLGGYEYTPQGPIDPLAAEQIIGAGSRIAATGGLGLGAMGVGATEAAVKAGDIAAHEPGKLGTAGGLARVAVAGAVPAGAMKSGMAIERAVASQGITGAKAFIANALADAGVGVGAGTVQKATEMIAAGVSPTSAEFWEGLKPTKEDAVMGIPSAIAAGVGGAAASGARRARQHARLNDLEQRLELSEIQAQGNADKAAYDQMVAANAAERQRIADVEARAAQTRDIVEAERAKTNRVQEEQSIIEARRNIDAARRQALREAQEAEAAFRENPTMENAQARVDAIDRANELANVPEFEGAQAQPEQPRLALPMPEGMTAGEFPGRMINPTKGGGSSELPTREGQGQATGRPFGLSPLRRQSQAIEATPPTAGEGVINQRGEQVQMPGEPVKRTSIGMNRLQRGQGASSPIEQQEQFNPELGQFKTSTLGDAEQPVVDMSYTDADALQRARRGTIPVADTLAAGEQIARQKGADLVSTWKPGKAFNAEEHSAVRSYVGGLNEKIADLEARDSSFLNPTDRGELFKAHEELFKATAAMVGTKTEAGRALRAMRESFAPVQFDPETGKAVKPPVSDSPNISVDDRTKAATYLTKLYGDKPVPQSVIDEIAGLKPDDAEGLFKILQRQTKVNNKTKPIDAFVNAVRAGMLTGVRTLERNFGGIGANVALRDVTQRVGSVLDWAMSKGTKQRTITSIGLSPLVRNAKSAVGEGAKEGWQVLTGKSSPTEIRSSMERMELSREQYTGDRLFNKALDKSVNTVFRAMAAADLPGRKFAYKNSILDQAQAVAKTEVLQGAIHKSEYKNRVKELALAPTDAMKLEAGLQSEMAVFAEENIASKGLSLFKNFIYGNLEKRGTFGRIGAGGLKIGEAFTTPFLKTPANISWDVLTRVLSDLPAGVGKAAQVALRKEPMTAAEQKFIAESIARGGVGLGIAMTGYILGVKGSDLLSGTSEQETTSMRETNQVAGKQPGSATIGGKNARIQEVFSPASNILVWGYSVGRESVKPLKNEESRLGNVLGASAKVVTENPMNEGIERVSKLGQPGGIQNFAAGSVSALVPTIVSDVATLGDDTQRDSHKQPGDSFGDVIVKSIQRRLPGLRNKLPAKVNAFGQVETEDRWNVIDPTFRRDAKWQKDKAIGELVRLNVGLPKPKRRENETEQQYLARVKRNGDAIKNKLDTFVSGKGYNAMSDDIKRDRLYKITHSPSINTLDKIR